MRATCIPVITDKFQISMIVTIAESSNRQRKSLPFRIQGTLDDLKIVQNVNAHNFMETRAKIIIENKKSPVF